MSVREFDGTDDQILTAGTGSALFNGAYTVVLIVKPLVSISNGDGYMTFRNSGSFVAHVAEGPSDRLAWNTGTTGNGAASVVLTPDAWMIAAVTKDSVSEQARTHTKPLGSGSWNQDVGGDALGAIATSCNQALFGQDGFGTYVDARLATAAYIPLELTDGQVQSIQTTPSTQQLADLGATHLWEFNQASTATAVEDLVGDWDQSSITGTTVVGGDDPSGWTFGLAGAGPTGGGRGLIRPTRHRGRYPSRDSLA
jgi:hypothetical protein